MEKFKFYRAALVFGILICWHVAGVCANPERVIEASPNPSKGGAERREAAANNLFESAKRWEGVREITGNNDHMMITKAMKLCGLAGNKGYPWCAACMADIFNNAGVPAPYSARVTDWFKTNVIWQTRFGKTDLRVLPGTVGALYYQNLGRLGHIFLIVGEDKNNYYTLEGNTDGSGTREGDGFYKKIRSKKSVAALADYCVTGKDWIELYEKYLR